MRDAREAVHSKAHISRWRSQVLLVIDVCVIGAVKSLLVVLEVTVSICCKAIEHGDAYAPT